LGSFYKPKVAGSVITIGLDATPDPIIAVSDEATRPVVSSDPSKIRGEANLWTSLDEQLRNHINTSKTQIPSPTSASFANGCNHGCLLRRPSQPFANGRSSPKLSY
jgi:hypothetical protein